MYMIDIINIMYSITMMTIMVHSDLNGSGA